LAGQSGQGGASEFLRESGRSVIENSMARQDGCSGVADAAGKADNRVFNPRNRLREARFGPNPDMRLDEYSRYGIL
jgi:hypothetical protein